MKSLGTEFKVGLFTIVGLIATGYLFLVLTPGAFERRDYTSYYTVLQDASGILPKTHVKTNGVTVGTVESVRLDVSTTQVIFRVDSDVKIPVGSVLDIRTVGLLGDKFIEILRVDDVTQGYVESGGLIPRTEDATDLNSLMLVAGDIAKDIKKITNTLAAVLGNDVGEDRVNNIIDNIEGLTANARILLEENRQDFRQVMASLKDTTSSISQMVNDENRERINRIIASFDTSMEDVRGATKSINLIAERVEQGEGTLGKLINDDQAIEELQAALTDIREVLSPANKLRIGVDMHGFVKKETGAQNVFNLSFRTRPDRFYLIGVTDLSAQIKDTTSETLEPGPDFPDSANPTRERQTIRERDRLGINLQLGKRWYWAQFRVGLFESTGGFATDLLFFRDRLRLTAEVFHIDADNTEHRRTAHLRAYARILFFDHVYMMLGVDDPTRIDPATQRVAKDTNYFVGAGITFDDDDLKAIFGAAALAL